MRLLWTLDHALQRRSKWMARRLGMTGPQRLVLRVAQQQPRISAGALADTLKLDPSTLTGVLARLERRGWLVRHIDPSDRRRAHLEVTSAARAAIAVASGSIEQIVRTVLQRTRRSDRAATARVLRALVEALEV